MNKPVYQVTVMRDGYTSSHPTSFSGYESLNISHEFYYNQLEIKDDLVSITLEKGFINPSSLEFESDGVLESYKRE